MIRIEKLTDDIEKEIDRLSDGPTLADLIRFEIVLTSQFSATQSAVHKITGSLALSGKVESNTSQDSWEGIISYGGRSTGIHNPVDYAEFERERGAAHDFLRPAIGLSDAYVKAMNDFLGG